MLSRGAGGIRMQGFQGQEGGPPRCGWDGGERSLWQAGPSRCGRGGNRRALRCETGSADRPRCGWNGGGRPAGVGDRPDVAGTGEVALVLPGIIHMCRDWDRSPPRCGAGRGGPSPAAPMGGAYSPAPRDVTRVLIPTVATGNGPPLLPSPPAPNSALLLGRAAVRQCYAVVSLVAWPLSPAPTLLMLRARQSGCDRCGAGGASGVAGGERGHGRRVPGHPGLGSARGRGVEL